MAMAKIKGKGTILKIDIASTLTAISQVISISDSGAESETYDATTLDTSGAGKEYAPTGYTEPGSVDCELFYDHALSVHQAITDILTTPAVTAMSLTNAAATPFAETFSAAGVSFGRTYAMNDGVKASCSFKRTGLPAYST